jgi:hypothetical protein
MKERLGYNNILLHVTFIYGVVWRIKCNPPNGEKEWKENTREEMFEFTHENFLASNSKWLNNVESVYTHSIFSTQ